MVRMVIRFVSFWPLLSVSLRGEVINGGFGLLLDGSAGAAERARSMLNWDVSNGVARRWVC